LLVGQFSSAQSTFTKPSEAYEYASRPVTEWDTALQEHRKPITRTRPDDVLSERSKVLCPSFALDSASGEELYFLAKLCEPDHAKALLAVSRYLAGSELAHGPDARLLLAALQMRTTGNWEAAWGTIRTILQEDPIPPVEGQIDVAIDDEARDDPQKALEWSKERYAILRRRSIAEKPGVSPVSYSFVLNAGYDLVHRYYLAGETEPAKNTLEEMNSFVKSHPDEAKGWGAEDLHWANLEMHPAPPVTVSRMLGGSAPPSDVIQPGRVAVISFFFLGCSPCMEELPNLNALQKRYGTKRLLVTDVTTYKANSYLTPSTPSNVEASLEKARLEKAPGIGFVITSDETLSSYGVKAFPVVAVVDKMGRLRYVGNVLDFEDDDSVGQLIHKLVEE
ncbi:MAG: TlpA disulfide reductase family protein, partial [Candidatus Acidiferrales bacterium]